MLWETQKAITVEMRLWEVVLRLVLRGLLIMNMANIIRHTTTRDWEAELAELIKATPSEMQLFEPVLRLVLQDLLIMSMDNIITLMIVMD